MESVVWWKKLAFRLYLALPLSKVLFTFIRSRKVPRYGIRKYLRFRGSFDVDVDPAVKIKLMHYGNTIENELFWLGIKGWEENALRVWTMLSRHSSVIFDIGANTGLYTLIAGKANKRAAVYAFEPIPKIFSRLCRNVSINDLEANLFQFAFADADGQAKIYAADTISDTFDQATLNEKRGAGIATSYTLVKKRKLSTFIRERMITDIDLMKVDVETYEPNVLRGMETYLKAYKPSILIEILSPEIGHTVLDIIRDSNYLFYRIEERNGFILQYDLTPNDKRGNNFLLLNEEKHSQVKEFLGDAAVTRAGNADRSVS